MEKHFSLLFLNEEELNENWTANLHVKVGDESFTKEFGIQLKAPISMSLPLKLKELADKSIKGVNVIILNNNKKRMYDKDLTELTTRLLFDKNGDSETFALNCASLTRQLNDVRIGRAVRVLVYWEEE